MYALFFIFISDYGSTKIIEIYKDLTELQSTAHFYASQPV